MDRDMSYVSVTEKEKEKPIAILCGAGLAGAIESLSVRLHEQREEISFDSKERRRKALPSNLQRLIVARVISLDSAERYYKEKSKDITPSEYAMLSCLPPKDYTNIAGELSPLLPVEKKRKFERVDRIPFPKKRR